MITLKPPALSVARACELLELAPSSHYYTRQLNLPESIRSKMAAYSAAEKMKLQERIEQLCLEFSGYGGRRVTKQLQREELRVKHKPVNKTRVSQVMKEQGLRCRVKRAFVATTNSKHPFRRYPNLIRGLTLTGINQVWVADITYIRLKREFIYLAVILDSYSRRVIGWALDNTLESTLCQKALEMALQQRHKEQRQVQPGLIHHSDQGSQYASSLYTEALLGAGVQISMSARANPYDNARAESFMKTLKQEEVHLIEFYDNLEHARVRIGAFLEDVYNRKRLHSSLGYVPPIEFEQL